MSAVLVINSGSSSLKYQVVDTDSGEAVAKGLVERIGEPGGRITHETGGASYVSEPDLADHTAAMEAMAWSFATHGPELGSLGLVAVGHRVVQGGSKFRGSTVLTEEVIEALDELSVLAPLHNPANLVGVRVAMQQFDSLPHVAIFDTAFHATIPPHASTYAIDARLAERHGIRRYGFHGTSHSYVAREAAAFLGRDPSEVNLITLHLGNGASAAAIRGGVSVDTSMGLTPLEGLVMGTRSGDIDPAVLFHLARVAGLDIDQLDDLLNKRSGVLGMCGRQDMRDLDAAAAAGDQAASLALETYCYRIRKYIGAYTAALGRVDAIVFTAGIGENQASVRGRTTSGLEALGISVDPDLNAARSKAVRDIATASSPVRVLVVPTNEELEIARDAVAVVTSG